MSGGSGFDSAERVDQRSGGLLASRQDTRGDRCVGHGGGGALSGRPRHLQSRDPSFFTYASVSDRQVRNAVGRAGAEVGGDLLGLLGLSALLVPPALFCWGWTWVGGKRLFRAWRRGVGLVLLVPSVSLLATILHQVNVLPGGRVERPGGYLGDEVFRLLVFFFGTFGLAVLALTGLALAVIFLSERSFVSLLAWPSASLNWLAGRCRTACVSAWRARRTVSGHGVAPGAPTQGARSRPCRRPPSPSAPNRRRMTQAAAASRAKDRLRKSQARPSRGQRGLAVPPVRRGLYEAVAEVPRRDASTEAQGSNQDEMAQNSRLLEKKLLEFGVEGHVTAVNPGPVITSYELEPGPGIKINRIVALADDLALGLKAMSVRVVAPIPGKAAVGVEIPNQHRAIVCLRDVLGTKEFANESLQLPLALGKDSGGGPMVADLAQMPHLLIAGETGSGKSVCINSLILSFLYRAQPRDVRLLLIDPKRVELSVYNGIPHLVDKVVVDPKDAARRLQRVVLHMEERYKLFAHVGARNLQSYNRKMALEPAPEDPEAPAIYRGPLPLLVVVIDEFADLMMTAQNDVENAVMRLAQMARAVGIHLIVATQRPSVDVLTGVIKANFPARISFRVASKVDSRTILDMNGAEALLGRGDMLFVPPGSSKPIRIHGCNVTEVEIRRVVEFLSSRPSPRSSSGRFLPPEPERGGRGRRRRRAVPPGGGDGRADPTGIHLHDPAAAAGRLQPGRAHDRAHGARRDRERDGRDTPPRGAGLASGVLRCGGGSARVGLAAAVGPGGALGAPIRRTRPERRGRVERGRGPRPGDMSPDPGPVGAISADRHQSRLGQVQEASGLFLAKRPGKMRWEYQKPEARLFVTDGKTLWAYSPTEKQVVVQDVAEALASRLPLSFLAGNCDLAREFEVGSVENAGTRGSPPTRILDLKPKRPEAGIARMLLEVTTKGYTVEKTTLFDAYGNTTAIALTHLKLNTGLDDQQFRFTPPPASPW